MRVVIAPDSFKGSASAREVAQAIADGLKVALPQADFDLVPMADGGEGTVEALVAATNGQVVTKQVTGPLGEPVNAFFGILGDKETAVIEMAAAAGLNLVPPEKRNPLVTTTYGVGELIKAALDLGCKRIIVGIGGSATNDGGAGMAQALGVKLLDENGSTIGFGGGELRKLAKIDISGIDNRLRETEIFVACDVTNPLTGPNGASAIYGPQKGATPEMVKLLDENLRHYAEIIRRDLGVDIENVPGAGAAGGLGAGLMAFCQAKLKRGVELVIRAVGLDERIQEADLVITGEGKIDFQTGFGKVPYGVAQVAKRYNKPVIAIAGQLGEGSEKCRDWGIDACFAIVNKPMSEQEAMANTLVLLKRAAEELGWLLKTLRTFA
ncbi:MAG: glycerate kinase [Armatimonadetes bacterium]|nr:glycerate kinase [Armatimonadota bacterium]MCX7968515.1 glycerate kinase [Armatimonadota bacterium]MDW8144207.1 glycerate kinase [Armatimonadota bacterium]